MSFNVELYLLNFFQHICNRDDNPGDGTATEHAYHGNWSGIQLHSRAIVDGQADVLYCSGVQNGWTDMANRMPMMETGMVEPIMPVKTAGN